LKEIANFVSDQKKGFETIQNSSIKQLTNNCSELQKQLEAEKLKIEQSQTREKRR
jgi:hypothetical protein